MALIDFKVFPGIDKQDTTAGAENRWVDCDNVRFRYNFQKKLVVGHHSLQIQLPELQEDNLHLLI